MHELSRIFETKIQKSGDPGGGSLLAGVGVSPKTLFTSFVRRLRRHEEKRNFAGTPRAPVKG